MSNARTSPGERTSPSQSRSSDAPTNGGTTSSQHNGGPPPPPPQPPKPSACERCRRRKTKCDGQRPKCSSCIKANVDCIEHDANRRVERSYLSYLEQRIAFLESDGRNGASGPTTIPATNGHVDTAPASASQQNRQRRDTNTSSDSSAHINETPTSERDGHNLFGNRLQMSPTQSSIHALSNGVPPMSGGADLSAMLPAIHPMQTGPIPGLADPNGIAPMAVQEPVQNGVTAEAGRKRKASELDPDEQQRRATQRGRESSSSSDLHHSSSETEADALGPPGDQTQRHSALSCLVSVALEERQEPHMDEHAPFQLNDFLPAPITSAERHFLNHELRALHNLRTKVRQQLHVPEIARERTNICVYDKTVIARLMRRFFAWMGSVYPILHEVTAAFQVEAIYDGTAATLDKFQVWMALAIALASLTRSHRRTSEVARLGKDFYEAARKLMPSILSRPGIERLQSVLLVLVYSLLVPRSASAAYLSTTAMQFAIELKLYSETSIKQKAGRDELMADVSRRIFWTSYNIDRSLSVITGKPTTLSDDWITTQFPAACEDVAITREGIQPGAPTCQLKICAHQHTRLRQLQSCIQARLYTPSPECKATPSAGSASSPDDESAATDQWSWEMYDRLRAWRDSFTYPTPFITQEWIKLQFHLTTTYLFRPSPRRPTPDLDAVHVTLHSSVETLKLYKTMHRNAAINFSWMATHNLFMSGLAFLSSLRELRKKNANCPSMSLVDSVLQVQACASVLEVLALSEGDSGCRARDAFEQVSTLIIRQLEKSALDRNSKAVALRRRPSHSGTDPGSRGGVVSPTDTTSATAQTPLRSPRASSTLGFSGKTSDSSNEGQCKWALIALEESARSYFIAADRDGGTGFSLASTNEEDRHFLTHDRDGTTLDPKRLTSLPRHLYSIGAFNNAQPRGSKSFWASFVSHAPSRAGSPSASGPGDADASQSKPSGGPQSLRASLAGDGPLGPSASASSMPFDTPGAAPSSMAAMNVGQYGHEQFSPQGGYPMHHHSHGNHHHHHHHGASHQSFNSLSHQQGGGRRNTSGLSADGISPPSSAGTFDEFNLLSWFADPTSQAPSDGLGFTDLASENAMLQALGLSLPLPGLMPSTSHRPSPHLGAHHDLKDSLPADLTSLAD